jgi:hypothetical protein
MTPTGMLEPRAKRGTPALPIAPNSAITDHNNKRNSIKACEGSPLNEQEVRKLTSPEQRPGKRQKRQVTPKILRSNQDKSSDKTGILIPPRIHFKKRLKEAKYRP